MTGYKSIFGLNTLVLMVQGWRLRRALLLLAIPVRIYAASPGLAGARKCGECHVAEYSSQRTTYHARALQPILDSVVSEKLTARPVAERNGTQFDYTRNAKGLNVAVADGAKRASGLLEWAFGAGAQGITPVGSVNGKYFEHRISWYTRAGHPGLTIGQSSFDTQANSSPLGQVQSNETIFRCFDCHATGVRAGPDLSHMRPGIECERCHGPGGDHASAPARFPLRAARAPREVVQLCAQCHRLPQPGAASVQPEIDQPESVRFAPVGLMASRCFKSGKLSCTTCHSPHEDARRDAAFYSAKCLGCHDSAVSVTNCRRASKQNCLPCHMSKSNAVPPLEFTDHRIRISRVSNESSESVSSASARAHLQASKLFDESNDPARAVAEAEQARDLDPQNEAAWIQLGQIFLTHNTPLPALEIFDDARRIFPASPLVRLGKGLALKELQRYDQAAEELRACLAANPRLGIAFDALASMYVQISDFASAAGLAQSFIAANASDYRGYYYLGAAQEGLKQDPNLIEELLRRSLLLNPNFAASHALLGKVLLGIGRAPDAVEALEEAVRLRPDYTPAHLYLANAYRKLGRTADAAREFQTVRDLKAKEMQPSPSLSYHRGKR